MRIIDRQRLAELANRVLRRFDVELVRPSELWRTTSLLGRQPPSGTAQPRPPGSLRVFGPPPGDTRFEFSVVMPSTLRSTIADSLHSIFAQDLPGPVQTLIGVDQPIGDSSVVEAICRERPPHHTVMMLDPGYSTSTRHGGLHPTHDGGSLRTILSYLAASHRVAYLDDDNWWAPNHLSTLAAALEGFDWAWSRRYYAHHASRRVICEDVWDAIGPRAGKDAGRAGWVDPNCLAIDKVRCEAVLRWWGIPPRGSMTAMDADRNIFRILGREFSGNGTGVASVYYVINERDLYNEGEDRQVRIDRFGRAQYEAYARGADTVDG